MTEERTNTGTNGVEGHSDTVNEVFGLFKEYLTEKLEEKGKQLESKSRLDKEVTQLKWKGNQKQFELNAEVLAGLEEIRTENDGKNSRIEAIIEETKKKLQKRQKLIKIADKSQDG